MYNFCKKSREVYQKRNQVTKYIHIYNAQRVLISKIINLMRNFVWENIDEMFLTHSHRQRCRATYKERVRERKREREGVLAVACSKVDNRGSIVLRTRDRETELVLRSPSDSWPSVPSTSGGGSRAQAQPFSLMIDQFQKFFPFRFVDR